MSQSQSMALASLTATYTDSEGEEEADEESIKNQGTVTLTTPNGSPSDSKSTSSSRPQSPIPVKVTTRFAKLVSYHDDTIVSDEENEMAERHQILIIAESESLQYAENEEDDSIQLPPEPLGHCSMDLQEKILRLHERMQNNVLDMNAVIQQRKDFRNPSIYEKLIQYCGINELGTHEIVFELIILEK